MKTVNIPSIVLGELYYGANKSNQTTKRIQEIEQLEESAIILGVTNTTARIYGEIKNQLWAKDTFISENDIWISAIAKEHNITLLTNDNHFSKVDGILIQKA